MKNTATGAVGGALGGVAAKKVGDAIVKARNIATGRMKDGVKEVSDLAKKHGVKTTVGDISRNPIAQKAEVALEQVPVLGTSGFRQTQHEQVKSAALKITDKLKSKMNEADFKGVQAIQSAAASGDRNASRISKLITEAGDDSSKIIQVGAEVRAWRGSQTAGKLYDKVGDLAKNQGGQVTPNNAMTTLSQKIDTELKSLAPDTDLLKNLQGIKSRLDDPNIAKDFGNMRLLRSQLGDLAETYASGASPNKAAAKFVGDLRTSVDKDISNYALNSGNRELIGAYKRADAFYSGVMKNKDSSIAKALKSNKPDEIYSQFIKTGKSDRAANFYRNLDPKSQSALRYEMANTALEKASNANTGSFSPAKFALEFERMNAPYKSIFKGADKAEMDGFVKLMRHVERAGQYMENPPTGNRLTGVLMGGAAVTSPAIAVKIGISSATLKALLTTETGKRILLSANSLPAGSVKFENLLKMMQKLGVQAGANSTND